MEPKYFEGNTPLYIVQEFYFGLSCTQQSTLNIAHTFQFKYFKRETLSYLYSIKLEIYIFWLKLPNRNSVSRHLRLM